MSLRKRILLLLGGALALMLLVLSLISGRAILTGFADLEQDIAKQDLSRVNAAIQDKIDNIEVLNRDWACWDDAYEFMQTHNPKFPEANLSKESVENINLDAILYGDREGKIAAGQFSKRLSDGMTGLRPRIEALLRPESNFFNLQEGAQGCRTGFVLMPEAVLLVTAHPILPTQQTGKPLGTLIMAQVFDISSIEQLSNRLRMQVKMFRTDAPDLPAEACQLMRPAPATFDKAQRIRFVDRETILGYTTACDVKGNPALVLEVTIARDIYKQGRNAVTQTILWLLLAGGVFSIITIFLLDSIQRKLQASEERFRSLVENTDDAIILADKSGAIIYASPSHEMILGRAAKDCIGLHFLELLDSSFKEKGQAFFRKVTDSPGAVFRNVEACIRRADGQKRTLELTLLNRLDFRGVEAIIISGRDITDQLQSREALIRSERLAAVGTLASGIAHEFNNLHAAIIGFLEILLKRKDIPEDAREDLDTALESSMRASAITQNLLAFTRNRISQKADTKLPGVVLSTLRIVQREFQSEGIEIETSLPELPPIHVDGAQIGQVLMNLVINARHAMLGRAQKRLRVSLEDTAQGQMLRVSDNGCGIKPDNLGSIFTPFFTTKGEYAESGSPQAGVSGTGLGLSVSNSIVREHGGHITVDSKPGMGTTFSVFLPYHPKHSEGDSASISATAPLAESRRLNGIDIPGIDFGILRQKRIMAVDDEKTILRLLATTFKDFDAEVESFENCDSALQALQTRHFDLVVTDLQMPGMSGSEFLAKAQQLRPMPKTAYIIITGYAGSLETGANTPYPVITKPFTAEELLRRSAQAINSAGKA